MFHGSQRECKFWNWRAFSQRIGVRKSAAISKFALSLTTLSRSYIVYTLVLYLSFLHFQQDLLLQNIPRNLSLRFIWNSLRISKKTRKWRHLLYKSSTRSDLLIFHEPFFKDYLETLITKIVVTIGQFCFCKWCKYSPYSRHVVLLRYFLIYIT